MTCPHCGLAIVPTRKASKLCLVADVSTLSDADMRAYYKRTAPAQDAAFFASTIRKCGDRRLILAAGTLALQAHAGTLDRATVYAQLGRLQARWRGLEYADGLSAGHNRQVVAFAESVETELQTRQLEADDRELQAQGF